MVHQDTGGKPKRTRIPKTTTRLSKFKPKDESERKDDALALVPKPQAPIFDATNQSDLLELPDVAFRLSMTNQIVAAACNGNKHITEVDDVELKVFKEDGDESFKVSLNISVKYGKLKTKKYLARFTQPMIQDANNIREVNNAVCFAIDQVLSSWTTLGAQVSVRVCTDEWTEAVDKMASKYPNR
jgi:hypothetical protein